ncbi:NAD(P)-binding domain-containing protein [Subtercola sp. PAMC28395]|uniref:NAD(P)-binding domain-containing protein n=1 Tax=Subtercola sp. PAMC28395 TaxID=2846775 RepID=UPI001C0C00F9|nr:NAD(P)-binding domain-containing protein [Subtercola sp. PAMC28395]QWT22683.1 NAD(P)-binding domain-containing protein [Subtercola sp. PAMC28395]
MTPPAETRSAETRSAEPRDVDVVVIGAGQAGLSAGYHLRRRGFDSSDFVILDSEDAAGGAWRHRWQSLRMATVNGIYDLPGMQKPPFAPQEPAAEVLPRYFAEYERAQQLPIIRPVTVTSVRRADADPGGRLLVETRGADSEGTPGETWSAAGIINATGTWTKPFWPSYPGRFDFTGRQLHVAQYVAAEEFAGLHVAVVGGGISAVQLLDEISHVATTSWFTRREPVWRGALFDSRAGHDAVALVEQRVREGLPPQSVVSVTGLIWTPSLRAAAERGVLDRHPMFTRMEPSGVQMADGTFLPVDVILWATGFRPALDHLAPLKLRNHSGGIEMDGTAVASEPRVHLIGYGPSASTVGANRAGREAVTRLTATILPRTTPRG